MTRVVGVDFLHFDVRTVAVKHSGRDPGLLQADQLFLGAGDVGGGEVTGLVMS